DAGDRDRPQVAAQIAEVGEEGGAVKERWQEDDEHDVRVEVDLRESGDEAEQGAADDEHDRVGDPEAPRERAQARDGDQQPGDQYLGLAHATSVTPAVPDTLPRQWRRSTISPAGSASAG